MAIRAFLCRYIPRILYYLRPFAYNSRSLKTMFEALSSMELTSLKQFPLSTVGLRIENGRITRSLCGPKLRFATYRES